MSQVLRRLLPVMLTLSIMLMLAGVLLRYGPEPGAWRWPSPALLGAATLALTLSYLLRALRLQAEWRGTLALPWADCLRVTLLHSAALNWLPMRAGDFGYPLLLRRRWGLPLADSACSLLWLRVQDTLVLLSLALLAFACFGPLPLELAWALALAAVLGLAWLARHAASAAAWAEARWGSRRPVLSRLLLAAARNRGPTWWFCIGNWALKLVALASLLAASSGGEMLPALAAALAGEHAAALPVQAPAGFGSYEAAVAATLLALSSGLALSTALAAALVVHLWLMVVSALGALFSLPALAPATPPVPVQRPL